MAERNYQYIWRCAKCSYHFSSILTLFGGLKQEKKCPKCKCINLLTINNKEIFVHCRNPETNEGPDMEDETATNYGYMDN